MVLTAAGREAASRVPADGILLKPVTLDETLAAIHRHCPCAAARRPRAARRPEPGSGYCIGGLRASVSFWGIGKRAWTRWAGTSIVASGDVGELVEAAVAAHVQPAVAPLEEQRVEALLEDLVEDVVHREVRPRGQARPTSRG